MITVLSILLILIWALAVPFILGQFFACKKTDDKPKSCVISKSIALGTALMFAVFFVYAVPMIICKAPFHVLKNTWIMTMIILCLISLIIMIRSKKKPEIIPSLKNLWQEVTKERFSACVWGFFLLLVIFQTCLLTFKMHVDTDDARFIVDAMEAVSKDTMLLHNPITGRYYGIPVGEQMKDLTAPYPIFIALMSRLFMLHPAVCAHTVLPALFIPLSYLVSGLIGDHVFESDVKKRGLFLMFIALIQLFSFETIYSAGYTLLTIIWQGRSIAAVVMLPLLWYQLMSMTGEKYAEKTDVEKMGAKVYITIIILCAANAMLSNMGAIFAVILTGAYGLSCLIRTRSLRVPLIMMLCTIPDIAAIVLNRLATMGLLSKLFGV